MKPTPKGRGIKYLALFSALYTLWSYVVFTQNGEWAYPILNELDAPKRAAFFALAYFLIVVFFVFTNTIQNRFNRKDNDKQKTK